MSDSQSDTLHESGIHNNDYIDYMENLVESIAQNIVVIDDQGRIVIWNSHMEMQFCPKEKAIGKSLKEIFPTFWEEFKGKVWGHILRENIIQKGESSELLRYPLNTTLKKIRYFDLKASPLRNRSQKKILGCIIVMEDVTHRIYLETQLLRHARTTSLANLGASIAHEVRNPLNSISLNIQLIREGLKIPESSSREEMLEIAEYVLEEIQRLNQIIHHFLKFSRPPEPYMKRQDLNETIRHVVQVIREEARQSRVEINLHLDDLPKLNLDRNQFSQALYNIAINAIQAMREQGGGILEFTTMNIKDYILLEIRDNGPGFQVDDPSELFDLFFSTKEEGTGLGLAIANQIIERHEGRIVAENNLDLGACFSIYLPLEPTAK